MCVDVVYVVYVVSVVYVVYVVYKNKPLKIEWGKK